MQVFRLGSMTYDISTDMISVLLISIYHNHEAITASPEILSLTLLVTDGAVKRARRSRRWGNPWKDSVVLSHMHVSMQRNPPR